MDYYWDGVAVAINEICLIELDSIVKQIDVKNVIVAIVENYNVLLENVVV